MKQNQSKPEKRVYPYMESEINNHPFTLISIVKSKTTCQLSNSIYRDFLDVCNQ